MTEPRDLVPTVPSRTGGSPLRRRTLLVLVGDEVRPHPVPLVGTLTVGRGSTCDVQVDHPSISRVHLELGLADAAITVTDRDSANGTTLRGVRIPTRVAVQIAPNEPVCAGDVTLVVQELQAIGGPTVARSPRPSGRVVAGTDPIVIDPAMRRLHELATRIARGTIGVLLVGETGTGKEILAELVHRASPRAAGPLVRINCAALTETLVESELFGHEQGAFTGAQRERRGLLEAADGGTVFLDEIGELPLAAQAKLLRVLEEGLVTRVGATTPRSIDVRFVAATNRDLEAEAEAGRFRRDLYFRIAGVVLAIPPLRARGDEIESLARRFANEAATRLGRVAPRFDDAALAQLRSHAWPGNVRELRNAVERAVLLAERDVIEAAHLALSPTTPVATTTPNNNSSSGALSDELAAIERQRILAAIDQCGGNQTRAAKLLGIPRRTLIKRLDQYGIERPRKKQ
ncbi:MAG: sigma 54-interacting transcriptional regulator [Kofleriaceae bacterium]